MAGCGAVPVRGTDLSVDGRRDCEALLAALPRDVGGLEPRETRGGLGGAWGDPPVVLTCGVGEPADYDPTAGCQTVDGVDWYAPPAQGEDPDSDVVLTTLGRTPSVELAVPAEQRPPAAAMVDVAAAVKEHTEVTDPCR